MNPPVEIVDLFAGPGGIDVAAHWLGLSTVGIEADPNACATRQEARLRTEQGDVRSFDPKRFPDATVLAGGPPCQTYTVAGSGEGRRALEEVRRFARRMAAGEDVRTELAKLDDERTALVLEPLRWSFAAYDEGDPYQAIVLEQVPQALPVWEEMAEHLSIRGYSVVTGILRAEEYGVPQTRRRAVLIARRDGKTASMPEPTHTRYRKGVSGEDPFGLREEWVPMGKALGIRRPFEVVSNYGTGGDPKARGRRRSDEPASTVTGKIFRNLVEPTGGGFPRRFTFAEAGQLQTFPADYPWRGSDIAQQIGNAVPPLLALHVLAEALELDEGAVKRGLEASAEPWPPQTATATETDGVSLSTGDRDLTEPYTAVAGPA
ncbi:DNA cytosine methyltransferase [Streptomonospora salina]|uniref:DNA (cytosine-5-)-methyltransferase n=1 Tax=Streptomonospora salina TaxID=104205 RepID=A0A841E703_9ACTN|nr:DNA cytosine methyltransferase [Streptomonospora salina]MBB5998234.1 DNA (cytosine-5)-methyltransferase 1 [Streptomonospora salina]